MPIRMGADQNLDWTALTASALEWWRDAGVDVVVEDSAFPWLDTPAPATVPLKSLTTSELPLASVAPLPATLDAFAEWRMGEHAPDARWGGPAIAATGVAGSALMVLVDCPERGDREALMEGPVGRLFDRMLAAIGLDREAILLSAVCVRRPTTGRIPREIEERLGDIARHHVALAAPKKLLVLGDAASRAVLGTNAGAARGRWHQVNPTSGMPVPVVASHHPRLLLDRPAAKPEAWKDLLLLTGDSAA
jgi:DNA polymerase